MRKINPEFLLTISGICENLSAGWFGAAIIFPSFSDKPFTLNIWLLILDISFGILFFVIAYYLRKFVNRRKQL